jgi:protease II
MNLVFQLNWKHNEYSRWFIVNLRDDREKMFNRIKTKFDREQLTFETSGDIYEYTMEAFEALMKHVAAGNTEYYPVFDKGKYLFPISYNVIIV